MAEYKLSYTGAQIDAKLKKIDNLAEKSEVPTKTSDLTNDSGYITSSGAPVQSVNGKTGAVSLKASDVGALPNTTAIPSKLSDLTADSTHRTVTDTEKSTWNAKANVSDIPTVPTKVSAFENDNGYLTTVPSEYVTESELNAKGYLTEHQSLAGLATETYVNTQIAAIPTPDVSGQINIHNTATDSHNDIRLLVEGLTTRINTLANSDDTTLDQMSEIVAYIKNNKSLIEGITNNKVNVADIIDNLTTNVSNKPLSAAQGVVLKGLIDILNTNLSKYALASAIPTKVSQLQNDSGYLTEHQDISGKLDASKLPEAIDNALAKAKASGEFDGKDGAPGEKGDKGDKGDPGEPGQKGEQGIQGIPGEKGDTGEPGKDGSNGTSVTVKSISESTADGGSNVVTFSDGKTVTIKNGSKGNTGSNGVSATHSWSGTTLTVTSASGTSSANLKGDKGDKGDTGATGATGEKGADGYSPVRGKDYWTDTDKAEIKAYVDEAILGGAW